jgi:hypothetical protein
MDLARGIIEVEIDGVTVRVGHGAEAKTAAERAAHRHRWGENQQRSSHDDGNT